MRFSLPIVILIGSFISVTISTSATSIVPFLHLGEATLYSECVVLARAVESVETTDHGAIFKETRFESIEITKGPLSPGTMFSLRPYSRRDKGFHINIAGDFKPETGKTYLLFLYQNGEFWRPVMLSYYAFEQFQDGDEEYLVPIGGEGIEIITRPDGLPTESLTVYKKRILLQQLLSYSSAPHLGWDGDTGRSILPGSYLITQDRAVPVGCDFTLGGNLCRWQNAAIPIFYDNTGNPANWGVRFGNILAAMNTNYFGIDPSNGGSRNYVPDCVGGSAIGGNFLDFCDNNLNGEQSTLIIFDDPCNEIPDLNNCAGTLAFGGSYSSSDTHQFDGLSWENALYGFVVVNNGAPSCLSDLQFEQMMTHELTHVYRMGHLDSGDYPNQNMNPFCCNAINTKDQECMNYAYPVPAPVELLSFEVGLQDERQVQIKWVTGSEKDNDHFTIERSTNSIQFEMIREIQSHGTTTGGLYHWLDMQPLNGLNYYRLSQTDLDGTVKHLGIRAVTVGSNANLLSIHPNPVSSNTLIFSFESHSIFEGVMELVSTDGCVLRSNRVTFEKGIHQLQQPIGEIPTGIYQIRLYDGQQQRSARFVKH